jgi:hypothetical protein
MKRLQNTTLLKVKFLPATSTKCNRIKLIQTNNGENRILSANFDCEVIEFISNLLEKNKEVKSFSLAVDNTQKDYYLFNVDSIGNSFPNLLNF